MEIDTTIIFSIRAPHRYCRECSALLKDYGGKNILFTHLELWSVMSGRIFTGLDTLKGVTNIPVNCQSIYWKGLY
jgi:hypothetical protein